MPIKTIKTKPTKAKKKVKTTKPKKKTTRSPHEIKFINLWEICYPSIPISSEGEDIIPGRKYRFDFVHVPSKTAIEINGQIWTKGGHSSGTGLIRDYTKNNLAIAQGWVVFQIAPGMITPDWLQVIADTIRERDKTKQGL